MKKEKVELFGKLVEPRLLMDHELKALRELTLELALISEHSYNGLPEPEITSKALGSFGK